MTYYKISDTLLTEIADSIRRRYRFSKNFLLSKIKELVEIDADEPITDFAATTYLNWCGEAIGGPKTDEQFPFFPSPSFLVSQTEVGDQLLKAHTYTTTDLYNYAYIKVAAPATTVGLRVGGAMIVDWGDGTQSINSNGAVSFSHIYDAAGDYVIRFSAATSISKNFITPYSCLWRLHTSTIKALEDNALQYQSNLRIVTFSDSLTSVGDNCFLGISNLNALVFPTNTQIGDCLQNVGCRFLCLPAYSGFEPPVLKSNSILELLNFSSFKLPSKENLLANCPTLKRICLTETAEKIAAGSFNGCRSLEAISIPAATTTIGPYAFQYCHGIQAIYVYATTPPTLQDSNVFTSNYAAPIYVPKGTLDTYKTATNWILYSNRLREMED